MNRDSESRLLGLCVRQHATFAPEAWYEEQSVSREELAAAARLLAECDWFGHREELLQVAEHHAPGSSEDFAGLVRKTHFDCPRFAAQVKAYLKHAGANT